MTPTDNVPVPSPEPGPPDRGALLAILATGLSLAAFTRFSAEEVIALLGALGALYRVYHRR